MLNAIKYFVARRPPPAPPSNAWLLGHCFYYKSWQQLAQRKSTHPSALLGGAGGGAISAPKIIEIVLQIPTAIKLWSGLYSPDHNLIDNFLTRELVIVPKTIIFWWFPWSATSLTVPAWYPTQAGQAAEGMANAAKAGRPVEVSRLRPNRGMSPSSSSPDLGQSQDAPIAAPERSRKRKKLFLKTSSSNSRLPFFQKVVYHGFTILLESQC